MSKKRTRFEGFGERIRKRIASLEFENPTRFALAKGYNTSYVYLWINETKQPNPDNLARLAADLGVTQAWILFGDEPPAAGSQSDRRRPQRAG